MPETAGSAPVDLTQEELDLVASEALGVVSGLMERLQKEPLRREAVGILLIASYNLMRNLEGDKFVLGWLESAIQDVTSNPPAIKLDVATQH